MCPRVWPVKHGEAIDIIPKISFVLTQLIYQQKSIISPISRTFSEYLYVRNEQKKLLLNYEILRLAVVPRNFERSGLEAVHMCLHSLHSCRWLSPVGYRNYTQGLSIERVATLTSGPSSIYTFCYLVLGKIPFSYFLSVPFRPKLVFRPWCYLSIQGLWGLYCFFLPFFL